MRSRLLPLNGQSVYESGWNRVRIVDRPISGDTKCAGEVHLIVPFVRTKWEGQSARGSAERSYIGDAYFVAHYDREVDADSLIRELELRDYSIGPYQDPVPYPLGWTDGPIHHARRDGTASGRAPQDPLAAESPRQHPVPRSR